LSQDAHKRPRAAIQTARANIFFIFFMSLASLMDYEFHAQAELRVEMSRCSAP
jgi:hypothetical protein